MAFSRKCKVVFKRVYSCTKKFCNETSLHCFRFITDPNSSKFKSYFWGVVCLVSTCLCLILIQSQFRSYYSNRITTTILTTAFPIWDVPFPAVTICNFNLVYKDNTKKIREILEPSYSSETINNFFGNLSSFILSHKLDKQVKWSEYYPVIKTLERSGYNSEKLMSELAHSCDNMISDCYWNNQELNCSEVFQQTKTNIGFCCSFNYKRHKVDETDEIYVTGVGPAYGLYLHLNIEEEQYLSSFKNSIGIDVSVHENNQYPDMATYSTTVRPGNDIYLSVKPEITQSEETVKTIDLKTRGCAFAEEIKMHWTSEYSYPTCINRCKAKAVQKLCYCVPYYYYPVTGRTRFCTLSDMACIKKNIGKLKTSKMRYNDFHYGQTNIYKSSDDSQECKCYPQCNEIAYSYQLDQEPLKTSSTDIRANSSILRVYFGHVSCTKLLRKVLITWELILASVGGLIGLCLGGSILSVIETVYYILESVFSRYGKKKKVDKREKVKYKPKLYLSDFGHVPNEAVFQIPNSNVEDKNNKKRGF